MQLEALIIISLTFTSECKTYFFKLYGLILLTKNFNLYNLTVLLLYLLNNK